MLKKYHVSKNLFDGVFTSGYHLASNGKPTVYSSDARCATLEPIDVTNANMVTFSFTNTIRNDMKKVIYSLFDDSTLITRVSNMESGDTIDVSQGNKLYLCIYSSLASVNAAETITDIMLNIGSSPEPYEPYGNTWTEIPYRKYATETDTLTSLPEDIIADGNNAEVLIKGNMQQTGTPSPSSIITPEETGERTGQLFDKDNLPTIYNNKTLDDNGNEVSTSGFAYTEPFIDVTAGEYITIAGALSKAGTSGYRVYFYNGSTFLSRSGSINPANPKSFQIPNNCNKIALQIYILQNYPQWDTVMINNGDTTLPYEPYGYKLPVLSGGVTTPVYISEPLRKIGEYADKVEGDTVTRYIKKLALDGTETLVFYNSGASGIGFRTTVSDMLSNSRTIGACSHFTPVNAPSGSTTDSVTFGVGNSVIYFVFSAATATALDLTDIASIKSYLAAQYAAGTPVCVWYVLAEPTTEAITMPTIPTTAGSQTFDVNTSLKPSEVQLTYKGWHKHSPKEYNNGSWA